MDLAHRRGCGCCEHCQCSGLCVLPQTKRSPPAAASPRTMQQSPATLPNLQISGGNGSSPRRGGSGDQLLEGLQHGIHPNDLIGKQQQLQQEGQQQPPPPTIHLDPAAAAQHIFEDGRISKEIPIRSKEFQDALRSHSRQQQSRRAENRSGEVTAPTLEVRLNADATKSVDDRFLRAPVYAPPGGGNRPNKFSHSRQASEESLRVPVVAEALSRGRSLKEQVSKQVDRKLGEGLQIGGYTLTRTKSASTEDPAVTPEGYGGLSVPFVRARSASRHRRQQAEDRNLEREDIRKRQEANETLKMMKKRAGNTTVSASRRITRDDLLQALRKTAAEREREEERERQKELNEEALRLHDRRMAALAAEEEIQKHRQQPGQGQLRRLYFDQHQQHSISTPTLFVSHFRETHSHTILFSHSDSDITSVAFRLVGAAIQIDESKGEDWVRNSLEKGTKVKGKLYLCLGESGPILYELEPRRKSGVDGWLIKGSKDHEPKFATRTHYGDHNDYRNVYFRSPQGKAYKWYTEVQPHTKIMRLFGRSSDEHGTLFAQVTFNGASNNASNHKKQKHHQGQSQQHSYATGGGDGADSAVLTFHHPISPNLGSSEAVSGKATMLDEALICATWFCARQTWDESRVVEAHKEVRLIEEIERAFEIDLLGAA